MIRHWLLAAVLGASAVGAQREPVLKQIKLPHAYYYREMYLPQVTSGPSSVTWSPDGQSVIYSMQGYLWRQRLGTTEAEQLTAGPQYDFQPDWSPDGRKVVYTSYRGDAEELMLLDLASGETKALTSNGAVNVEPRWSPDGARVAFVSTAYQGRFHIFVWTPDSVHRVTEDHDSGLPRYYYSVFDDYLSPSWSADGKELLYVSNRGHIYGTGGIWRGDREIHYEETNWKARPDWSRDGRIVFSSYTGRQWNQLWLMGADGANPFQLTYGDFDATAPRWSPDGHRIAYIVNDGGTTSLRLVDVPGGGTTAVLATHRHYKGSVGTLQVRVRDATGHPMTARVSVTGAGDRSYAPDDAWRYADDAFDRHQRRFEIGYFHTLGESNLTTPAESVTVTVSRGLEYHPETRRVAVRANDTTRVVIGLPRLANLAPLGWYSGDLHVHMNYGGTYRNTPAHLAEQARAEDLHVIENLIVNKEGRIPDVAYFAPGGRADPVSDANTLIVHGQEYHTSYWGHLGLLGLRSHLILPGYAGYAETAAASLVPTNADVAALARAEGRDALVGYVHPFDTIPDPANRAVALTDELPVDVALGDVDYMEIVAFSDHRSTAAVWYRLLNCGFRIPAGAGTDAMANFASLRGPVGLNRVFVHTGPGLWHGAWLDSLRAGRTFATNGPLLTFTIDGHEIGEELRLAGPSTLHVHATLASIVPVDHFELVGPSGVAASATLTGDRTTATFDWSVPVTTSGWYTVRAYADSASDAIMDLYPFATTSPIYVTVAGQPVRSASDAAYFVAWIDRLAEAVRAYTAWNTPAEQNHVLAQLDSARAVFKNH
jgi:TolB protein